MEIQKIPAKLFVLSSIDLKDDIEEVSATICAAVCECVSVLVSACVCVSIGWLAFLRPYRIPCIFEWKNRNSCGGFLRSRHHHHNYYMMC